MIPPDVVLKVNIVGDMREISSSLFLFAFQTKPEQHSLHTFERDSTFLTVQSNT